MKISMKPINLGIAVLVLVMFTVFALKFGAGWTPLIWAVLLVSVLLVALVCVSPESALAFIKILPALTSKYKNIFQSKPKIDQNDKDQNTQENK